MTTRMQRGQSTSRDARARVSRPGQAPERRVTVPPVMRHDPAPAILSLKAEIERLINSVGLYIDGNGQVRTLGFLSSTPRSRLGLFVRGFNAHLDLTLSSGDLDLTAYAPVDAGQAQVTYYVRMNAESGTTDDFDTVSGLNWGDQLIAYPATGDTITVRDRSVSSGDFELAGATAFAMDNPLDRIAL